MMMKGSVVVVVLCVCILVCVFENGSVEGWVPSTPHRLNGSKKSSNSNSNNNKNQNNCQTTRTTTRSTSRYVSNSNDNELQHKYEKEMDDEDEDLILSNWHEQLEDLWQHSETLLWSGQDGNNAATSLANDCLGTLDDCTEQECQIPDSFKILDDEQQKMDVMEFLGIRRAQPLRLPAKTTTTTTLETVNVVGEWD